MADKASKRYFIDTEFIESGAGQPIELLSLGIVCEDGREFYVINNDADIYKANDWVKTNVLPHLDRNNGWNERVDFNSIASAVLDFVGDSMPEFWGYYADYDWVVFCQIFGRMIDLPKGWPMFCCDIKQMAHELGNPKLPEQTSTEHNALNDARWILEAWKFLSALLRPHLEPAAHSSEQPEDDVSRCAVCRWTLVSVGGQGCWKGSCSLRPLLERLYNRERAIADKYIDKQYVDLHYPTHIAQSSGTVPNQSAEDARTSRIADCVHADKSRECYPSGTEEQCGYCNWPIRNGTCAPHCGVAYHPSTSSSSPALSDQLGKHVWNTVGDKPWTCLKCFFYTANLRHIENGYCRHDWIKREWDACSRCGVVKNDLNIAKPCIGKVTIALRESPEVPAPSEGARTCAEEIVQTLMPSMDGEMFIRHTKKVSEIIAHSLSQSTATMTREEAEQKLEKIVGFRNESGLLIDAENSRYADSEHDSLWQFAVSLLMRQPNVEQELRHEWWMHHGCNGHPYGDDGEMQCCGIDFKRQNIADLRKLVAELRMKASIDKPNVEPPSAPSVEGLLWEIADKARIAAANSGEHWRLGIGSDLMDALEALASFEKQNSSSQASTQPEGGRE